MHENIAEIILTAHRGEWRNGEVSQCGSSLNTATCRFSRASPCFFSHQEVKCNVPLTSWIWTGLNDLFGWWSATELIGVWKTRNWQIHLVLARTGEKSSMKSNNPEIVQLWRAPSELCGNPAKGEEQGEWGGDGEFEMTSPSLAAIATGEMPDRWISSCSHHLMATAGCQSPGLQTGIHTAPQPDQPTQLGLRIVSVLCSCFEGGGLCWDR